MVEHYLRTENRSETDHFVLNHCHRIQTVNSFWGLMLPFLSRAWLKFVVVGLGLLLVHMNMAHTPGLQVEKMLDLFDLYIYIYTTVGEIGACLNAGIVLGNLRDVFLQHCWRQSLGNKTKVIRWLVGLIHMNPASNKHSKAHGLG